MGQYFDTSQITNMENMFYNTVYTYMTTLNLGKFGVNHLDNVDLTNLFSKNYNNLQEIILKNESVKSWLDSQDATNILDEIKSKLKVVNEI